MSFEKRSKTVKSGALFSVGLLLAGCSTRTVDEINQISACEGDSAVIAATPDPEVAGYEETKDPAVLLAFQFLQADTDYEAFLEEAGALNNMNQDVGIGTLVCSQFVDDHDELFLTREAIVLGENLD